MEARHIKNFLPKLTKAPRPYRPFTTHLPHHLNFTPPSPPTNKPAPYYSPQPPSSRRARLNNDATFKLASNVVDEQHRRETFTRVAQYDAKQRAIAEIEKSGRARDLERQQFRKWKPGDVYAPHDLSSVEMAKWRVRRAGGKDVFDMLGINPLMEYKNCSMMSEYMTHMGRIRHRKDTGLRAVNQRKIAKAIRRAVGMGLVPSVHRHPEVLEVQAKARNLKKWLKEKGKVGANVAVF